MVDFSIRLDLSIAAYRIVEPHLCECIVGAFVKCRVTMFSNQGNTLAFSGMRQLARAGAVVPIQPPRLLNHKLLTEG
jgi:hypothetical protein